jgi:hypothetical protein
MRTLQYLLAGAMFGMIATAQAADNGVYAGVSVGQGQADVEPLFGEEVDEKDTGFKLLLGLRPLDWVGVEVSYFNLGEISREDTFSGTPFSGTAFRVKRTGFGASGVLFYDIANVDLFAKAGLFQWDSRGSFRSFFGSFGGNETGTDFGFGVGAQVRFGSLAARLEFEKYQIDDSDGLFGKPQMLSVGMTWTFF